eukprot:9495102-Pyramimonas_sp.AAC.1
MTPHSRTPRYDHTATCSRRRQWGSAAEESPPDDEDRIPRYSPLVVDRIPSPDVQDRPSELEFLRLG